jgi:putative endonuclease
MANSFKKIFANPVEIISFANQFQTKVLARVAELVDALDLPIGRQVQNPVFARKCRFDSNINSLSYFHSFQIDMFNVYAIKSETKNYIYVGLTSNLEERVKFHNNGYQKTTKPYRPFGLIYSEECADRQSARLREKYLKSGVGKDFLRSIK